MTAEAEAAAKSWEQATLLINGKKVEWGTTPLLFRGEENTVAVEAPDEIARELNLGLPEDGGLNIVASPAFGSWVARVNGKFEWKIKPDAGKSSRITLVFYSREILESWEHQSLVMSSNLADEADVKIRGVAVPAEGNWFYRGAAQTVTLTPKPGSPLAGLPVTLTCEVKSGLDVANVVSAPVFGSAQTNTYSWAVTGKTKSGTFELRLAGKGMTTPITLAISKLISSNLVDEAELYIDEIRPPAGDAEFISGVHRRISLRAKNNSPIGSYPLMLSINVGDLLPGDISCSPTAGQVTTDHSWHVAARNRKGRFELVAMDKVGGEIATQLKLQCRAI
jgi:hypothetical protein